ncbi:uncharacterized protein K452DRAFT_251343, partial [Aplosporella prunicola CBS 121167]
MGVSDRVLHHVVRRSVEAVGDMALNRQQRLENDAKAFDEYDGREIPVGSVITIGMTVLAFVVMYASIQYTLRHVITTLCMIETPAAAVTISVSDELDATLSKGEKEDEALLEGQPAITIVNPKPITSKIRNTLRHLTAHAGFASRWRGLPYGMVYSIASAFLSNWTYMLLPEFPGKLVLISVGTSVLCARLHMMWTHATIAMPSNKHFKDRASVKAFKQLALPAAVYEGVQLLVMYLAAGLAEFIQADFEVLGAQIERDDSTETASTLMIYAKVAGAILLLLGAGLFVILPAHVQLVRVEASLLPEDEETIVPFDRSFGGKAVPKVLGGSGAIGFLDAWRSFDREARLRLIKLYLKIFLVSATFVLLAVHVIALEAWVLASPALDAFTTQ